MSAEYYIAVDLPLHSIPKQVMLTEEETDCLQCLYTSNPRRHKERNPRRVPGTCEWFIEHTKYIGWRSTKCPNLLWVSADAGYGKSVLASFLIDDLKAATSTVDTTVCYFSFKDDNRDQKNSLSALRSILHQVFTEDSTLIKHAMSQFKLKGTNFAEEFPVLWDILVAITADDLHGRNIICILDGLDKCERTDRIQIIEYLGNFYRNPVRASKGTKFFLKFLITSRPEVLIEDKLFDLPKIRLRVEDETDATSGDIELVVQDAISSIGSRREFPQDQQNSLVKQYR